MSNECYLGDAVYASFDGYQIWLRTGDGNHQSIALEPGVFAALVRYADDLKKTLNPSRERLAEIASDDTEGDV